MTENYATILNFNENINMVKVRFWICSLACIFIIGSINFFVLTSMKLFLITTTDFVDRTHVYWFEVFDQVTAWFEISIPLIFGLVILYEVNNIAMLENDDNVRSGTTSTKHN